MRYTILDDRRLLKVSGEEASSFLQGLLTIDVAKLTPGQLRYTALLSPQGKFLHDMFIGLWQGAYWLDCNASRLPDLRQRLAMYKLRSKVLLELQENYSVAAIWQGDVAGESPDVFSACDPRLEAMGWRAVAPLPALQSWCGAQAEAAPMDAYQRWRISHAIPDGALDMIPDKSLLLEFGFEQLHGVDFNKGCYVGQEVTARSKFRAQLKKLVYAVSSTQTLPAAGTEIHAGDQCVGEMRSSQGTQGLAVLRMQELETAQAAGLPLVAGGVTVSAEMPKWLSLRP
jgi:folate-binding protein YgfZ